MSDEIKNVEVVYAKPSVESTLVTLITQELNSLVRNSQTLSMVEQDLSERVSAMINTGTLDLETAQEVIKTLNKSVERSSTVLLDRKSTLIDLLHEQVEDEAPNIVDVYTEDIPVQSLEDDSRQRIRNIVEAIMDDTDKKNRDENV